ncbi:ras association domain-containing protein 4a isoform X2 [Salmo trutta]|uniref:ras association domain-containing protein 4a isoform X2 n=1 Tax=Salmo trutta TaxID=8032 RepID=UPI0011328358|nr:ras association domain-containing protein 4 isoform X2 [Salmo trutta]
MSDILSLLRTYNCYHEGKSFQLRHREEEEALVVEGLLNIYWGLRRPIRLQMHDDNERLHYGGVNRYTHTNALSLCECQSVMSIICVCRNERSQVLPKQTESNNNILDRATDPALTCSLEEDDEEVPQLLRTRSDASFMGVTRRSKTHAHSDLQHLRSHRFSINGHFYNHKTSVFTPAFGSVTNVRVNSSMTTLQVLNLLLQKFRVENKADEFVLYMVHESGERTPLKDSEYPLVYRVLHGPCEKISKIFIMETDLGEEVTHDVAQYINFEMPVLDSFVEKLKEEEEREISKLTRKYSALKSMILQQLEGITDTTDRV